MSDSVQPQRQKPTLWWLLTEGPGSSVHGIFQARVLEWGAIAFSALMNSKTKWLLLVAQLVKNPPAMWETWVRSLGWVDTLEKGPATHSSILAWRIPWTV